MGELVIKAGSSGNTAEVDSQGRVQTFSTVEEEAVDSSINGNTFFIGSGLIDLITAGQSFLLYVKNDDTVDWIVDSFSTAVGPSTGAPGLDIRTQFVVGATGGTLLSGTDGVAVNLNLGDPKGLEATIKTGAEGSTVTGGGSLSPGIIVSDQITTASETGPIVITPGTSVAFGITPATGNTAMTARFNAVIYRKVNG